MTKKAAVTSTNSDVFSISKIRELLDLMREYDLSEIDLMQADQQIRLARGGAHAPVIVSSPAAHSAPISHSAASVAADVGTSGAKGSPDDGAHIKTIVSPMVGTFYSRPKPTSDDFVKVGARVSPDTVVCIIEAMKVFNEIPAELSGTIVEVLVSNEEAVDFNRPLFKVDTRS